MASLAKRIRDARRGRRGMASVVGGILVFGILFSVGYAYFLTSQQDYKSVQNSASLANEELMVVTGAITKGNASVIIKNSGSIAITIESVIIVNQTAGSQYGKTFILSSTQDYHNTHGGWEIPFSLNPQSSSNLINTTVPVGSNTLLMEAVTSRGTVATATVSDQPAPASQLALKALSAGSFGDLYLAFGSYTYYTITSHSSNSNCPGSSQNSSYSGYCLQTSVSGSGFDIPSSLQSNYGNGLAYSINMTSLNNQSDDVVLDQFTLMYQNSFYGNNHQNFESWYLSTVGTVSNGYIPILKNFQPQVLKYNTAKTIYFISGSCITASLGPTSENGYCGSPGNFNGPDGSGTIATVFLMSNGWELPPSSYYMYSGHTDLNYSGSGFEVNYGQNSPYVSTLYE